MTRSKKPLIRGTTLATEQIRKDYESPHANLDRAGRTEIGVLLAEIDALREDLAVGVTPDLCIIWYHHAHGTDSWVARRGQVDASICASILEYVEELDAAERRAVLLALVEGRTSDAIRIYCEAADELFGVTDVDYSEVQKDSADPVPEARRLLADLDTEETP